METSIIINIIGLSIDIFGVVLLFFFEPPRPENHNILLQSAPTEEERKKEKNFTYWALSFNNWFYSSNYIKLCLTFLK